MTAGVALSLMAGARVDHLVLCDEDDRSTGLTAPARLAVLRGSPACTDRIRPRDVPDGPFARSEAVGEPGPRRSVSALRSGHTGTTGGTASRDV
ncbi:CBS domain-containing protein [Streptomyces sp. NPDC020731]|uniref:CBS domain-containing protein n=1 Tax=Streptomyces sp. NPDC020731 TaxID=3365085 RepID=UPI0037A556CF